MPIRFQVDPDFYDHPKAIGMSDSATALWVRAGSYSAAKLTDGFIAENALSLLSRCSAEAASELVARGLWKKVRGGYSFHQWSVRNLSRGRVEADREADRERKRRDRQTPRSITKPQVEGQSVRPDSDRNPGGIRSVSVSVSESVSESGSGRGLPPPSRCPQHPHLKQPPPCGQCRGARTEHDQWLTAKAQRLDIAPKCRVHRGQLAANCALCRSEELSPA